MICEHKSKQDVQFVSIPLEIQQKKSKKNTFAKNVAKEILEFHFGTKQIGHIIVHRSVYNAIAFIVKIQRKL